LTEHRNRSNIVGKGEPPMKLNLKHQLWDLDSNPITIDKSGAPATVEQVFQIALKTVTQKEQLEMSNKEAVHRRDLMIKIRNNGENTEFMAEDIALLERCIEGKFIPLVVATCCDILSGKSPTLN
jgi:hypothetical protein